MRSSIICALTASLVVATPFVLADESANSVSTVEKQVTTTSTNTQVTDTKAEPKTISAADQSVIVSNVLCQNVPAVNPENVLQTQEAYAKYIEQVAELFGNNAKNIKSDVVGINKDHQMSYELNSPINIVGITFNKVNILTLKGQDYNYYQITASKPITPSDEGLVKNIPQTDKLTVSVIDKKLSIMCNVIAPMVVQ